MTFSERIIEIKNNRKLLQKDIAQAIIMLPFDSISDTRKIKRSQRYPFSSPSPIISMYLSTTSSAGLITRIEDSQQILLLP